MAQDAKASAMSAGAIRAVLGAGLAALLLSLFLFGDCPAVEQAHALGSILGEVAAALGDPGTQWVVFLCAGVYLVGFVVLRGRLAGAGRNRKRWNASLSGEVWLAGLVVVVALAYALEYTQAVKPAQALTLVGTAMVGQGTAFFESRKQKAESRNAEGQSRKQKTENRNGGVGIVIWLIVLLSAAAVWQGETGHLFQYRGQARWSGPWDNPNTFGLLMGVGLVLAVGRLVQSLKSKVQSLPNAEHRTSNIQHPILNWGLWVKGAFFLGAAAVMGVGVLKSYSRGAWVGTAVGLVVLAWMKAKGQRLKSEEHRTPNIQHRMSLLNPQPSTLNPSTVSSG